MLWILHWLLSSEYRARREHVMFNRRTEIRVRRLYHAIFPDGVYFKCHCGRYSDKSRLCEEHKVSGHVV